MGRNTKLKRNGAPARASASTCGAWNGAASSSIMARDDLAAGRLVRLFPEVEFASVLAYYVVSRPECATLPKVMAFREWLIREAVS
ncbi:hypothetical protein [Corallococcus exercitus]|uniref:hypothetical protein n=1 Tax=Corallococcus exercitus TaxID=2316736 RepID=UPI0020A32FAB|nr:hypothetical protein [Corallococcus exercitus]